MCKKRCLKIIFPVLSYNDALKISGLEHLSDRREKAAHELFKEIKKLVMYLANYKQVKTNADLRITRDVYPYKIPRPKTSRLGRSLIVYGLTKRW